MKLYFLHHSGFMVEDKQRYYVFDYYKDPKNEVISAFKSGKEMWFFVSHSHGDHFNPAILNFDRESTKYFIHKDVPFVGRPKGTLIQLTVGDHITVEAENGENVELTMYGSTDEGGSFLVKTQQHTVFHAGDLNWWHWAGDTQENIRYARQFAEKEFARVSGVEADVAFFPVDARLEKAREWGAIEFLHVAKVKSLFVPMHYFGEPWEPSNYFKAQFEELPLWIPQQDGEVFTLDI